MTTLGGKRSSDHYKILFEKKYEDHYLAGGCTIEKSLRACINKTAKRSKRDQLATQPEMFQKKMKP